MLNGPYEFESVLLFESERREVLTGIEVWPFREESADIRFLLDGADVFRTPSGDLVRLMAPRGHDVVESDCGYDEVPDPGLRFANNSGFEYYTDDEGDPLHDDYILLFDPHQV
ncbi:hypothetical protein OIB37_35150 [Streptomyces sp. NBC_00820]|uniref:hypothetical protein n=1 Tax=Streptomyces sp. NBC_00820 TaxID=2975842 RepID=UPI002ED5C9DF|nr:hypothetical protein OIB37_35150 [Streptomyces sp. NBC_00820]